MMLHLVCDISGSMSEGGKYLAVRGIVLAIGQYSRLGYGSAELQLVAWSNEAQRVEWVPDNDFPAEMLDCTGTVKADKLIALLGNQPAGKVLLVTDGFWSQEDEKTLKRWKQSLQRDTLRIIKVGADANPRLKGPEVFIAEELFAALDGWLEGGAT